MKRIETDLWFGAKDRAITFSFDDGRYEDYRLIAIMNSLGLKGSFHISNPGFLTSNNFQEEPLVSPNDYKNLYEGHEISCHMENHPFPTRQPNEAIRAEILNNKIFLEKYCGYPVRGMSYPYSDFNNRVIEQCRAVGMEYSRTAYDTMAFTVPEDFMHWNPTCHFTHLNEELVQNFYKPMNFDGMRLLYVWGHSYEINTEEKWVNTESKLKLISKKNDVWYATNIQIYDYIQALRNLKFSTECTSVYNPSSTDVWIRVDHVAVPIPAGTTISLN